MMNVGDLSTNNPVIQEAEKWGALLKKAKPEGNLAGRKYIVLEGDHFDAVALSAFKPGMRKISIAEIVQISRERFEALKEPVMQQLETGEYLTSEQFSHFGRISNDIVSNTESLIRARFEKRGVNRIVQGVDLVVSYLSFIHIGPKIWQDIKSDKPNFEREIADLSQNLVDIRKEIKDVEREKQDADCKMLHEKFGYRGELVHQIISLTDDVPMLIDSIHASQAQIQKFERSLNVKDRANLINAREQLAQASKELNAYVLDIQKNSREFDLPFDRAAKLSHLKYAFHKEEMPFLKDQAYTQLLGDIINGVFYSQLDAYYQEDVGSRSPLIEQFQLDIPRSSSFKRFDSFLNINDLSPHPSADSPTKLSDASQAITDLIIDVQKDGDWAPILQLVVTQTNLNGAFMHPRLTLTDLGSQVVWNEGGNDYHLLPEFPAGLPPAQLDLIRDEKGGIRELKVSIEGNLDLIKKQTSFAVDLEEGETLQKTLIKGAVQSKLSYIVTMGPDKKPLISHLKSVIKTSIPQIG